MAIAYQGIVYRGDPDDFDIAAEQEAVYYRARIEAERAEYREALLADANAIRQWDSNELIERCLDALSLLHSDPCEYARYHLEAYRDEADRRITAYMEREIAGGTFRPLPVLTSTLHRGAIRDYWESAV